MKLYCGKHPQHYFVAGICKRCGAVSRNRRPDAAPSARTVARLNMEMSDSYLSALQDFAHFCRDRDLPFKTTLVSAMRRYQKLKRVSRPSARAGVERCTTPRGRITDRRTPVRPSAAGALFPPPPASGTRR